MRIPASFALAVNAGQIVNIARTPLAAAGQLARTQGRIATATPCLLRLGLAGALARVRGGWRGNRDEWCGFRYNRNLCKYFILIAIVRIFRMSRY